MSYLEKNFASDMCKHIKTDPFFNQSCLIEYKLKKDNHKLHLINDFQPQQLPSLQRASEGRLYHKVSDSSLGSKPADSFILYKSHAYVIICWYTLRKPKEVYCIPIHFILHHLNTNLDKPLLSKEQASQMSVHSFTL